MSNSFHDIRALCDFLEAELEGRPFDRSHAHDLAARLADQFPSIQRTMGLLRQRFSERADLEASAA